VIARCREAVRAFFLKQKKIMYNTLLTEAEYTANLQAILNRTQLAVEQAGASHNWTPTVVGFFAEAVQAYFEDTGNWPSEDEAKELFALILSEVKAVSSFEATTDYLEMNPEMDQFLGKTFRKWANPEKKRKGLGKVIQSIGKGIGKGGLAVGKGLTWVALKPFEKVMIRGLQARGRRVKANISLGDLAREFLRHVVSAERPDLVPQNLRDSFERDTLEPLTISAIVTAIISFVKGLKKKEQDGEELTPSQAAMVRTADSIQSTAFDIATEEADQGIGGFVRKNAVWIVGGILALAGIAVFFIGRSKK
jgi:hypothetical protein